MTKQRYFSNFEKCSSIFGHQLECTKPESSRLQYAFTYITVYICEDVDELKRCLTAVCADIKHGSGTLGILPFMAKWTLGILDSGGWGVGGLTTFCGRDCIAIACYVQQRIT